MPTSHWVGCGRGRGRGHSRAKIGILHCWITHARRPRGYTRIYLLLHHDRERDLRDLRRVCVGYSPCLENRPKAILRSRGALLGLLCLTKPSFIILFPLIVALILLYGHRSSKERQPSKARCLLGFSLAFAIVLGPWTVRNAISVEKFGLTEEYGAAALIERFAYDDMTPREFLQAFP